MSQLQEMHPGTYTQIANTIREAREDGYYGIEMSNQTDCNTARFAKFQAIVDEIDSAAYGVIIDGHLAIIFKEELN